MALAALVLMACGAGSTPAEFGAEPTAVTGGAGPSAEPPAPGTTAADEPATATPTTAGAPATTAPSATPASTAAPPTTAAPVAPSKIAGLVAQAARRVAAAAAGGATDLSGAFDPLVEVDRSGRLAVVLHAAGPFPAGARANLSARGTEVVSQLDGPLAWTIQAWVPYDRLEAVVGLDWVVAVTPFNRGAHD